MRRAPLVLGATAAGLAGVLTFHTHSAPLALGGLSKASGATGRSTSSPGSAASSPTASAPSSTTTPITSSPSSTTTAPRATTTTAAPRTTVPPTTAPRATTTTVPPTTAPSATRSATGPSVDYSYGTLSVSVTASGSKITNVAIAALDDGGEFRSQQIDQYSIPILEQQAMSAQGASIQGVSGATYTSTGFQQSLQGALTKLGL